MYLPRIVAGFTSSLSAILPLVLPAEVSIAFGSCASRCGIHPRGFGVDVIPPQCALSLAFM